MQTDFFKNLASLELKSTLKLVIRSVAPDKMVITIQVTNGKKDGPEMPVWRLSESADALDKGFFERLTNPPKDATTVFNNHESFISQLDKILQSNVKTSTTSKPAPLKPAAPAVKNPVDKKYEAKMSKAKELEDKGEFRAAYKEMPDVKEFPKYTIEIENKKNELIKKISDTELFGGESTPADNSQPPTLISNETYTSQDDETEPDEQLDDEDDTQDNDDELEEELSVENE